MTGWTLIHDHPARGPHVQCLADHGGKGVSAHCRRGCRWPCPDASVDPRGATLGQLTADLVELVANSRPGPKPHLDGLLMRAALRQRPPEHIVDGV